MKTQKKSSRKSKQPMKRPQGILHPPKAEETPITQHRESMQQRRRLTPRVRALMEEKEAQEIINMFKPKFPLMPLIIALCLDCCGGSHYLWQLNALAALHEASEAVLIALFQLARLSSHDDKRTTISVEDIQSAGRFLEITESPE